MKAKLKVGMISFAHMHAASYLQALLARKDVELVGIADENRERVRPFLERYGLAYYEDAGKLLAADVDAVVICSENVRHAPLTIQSARAGKHVLCEKPLGISEVQMREMIEACRANGVQLMTAFPCRYLASVIEAKAAVDRGDIGRIVAVKGTNRGTMPGGWFVDRGLSGGGAVLDHTVHVMDLMNWFLNSEPEEVFAYAATLFHREPIDDAGMVHVKFRNGVIAVLDPSWSRPAAFPTWGDVTLELIGTKGALFVDAFAQKNEIYNNERMKPSWSYWGDSMDDRLIEAFVLALREGRSVPITGEDGFRSARVALAAYASAQQGKPIRLAPWDGIDG